MNEFGGGDNFAVTFYNLATERPPTDGDASRLTGNVIGVSIPTPTVTITTQPQNTTVYAGTRAEFVVAAQSDSEIPLSYQWRRGSVEITNATSATYSLVASASDNAAQFDCVVSVAGLAPVTSAAATLTVQTTGGLLVNGKLKNEFYSGKDRATVESGAAGPPAFVGEFLSFHSPVNSAENFARLVSGYFIPPTSGNYVFFACSDDDSDLFLSTDESPSNKRLIAQEQNWSGDLAWVSSGGGSLLNQKRSDRWSPDGGVTKPFSGGIALVAGTHYYIEGVAHQEGGGDNFSATYKLLADADPVDGDATRLTNGVIAYITRPVTGAAITTQPQSVTLKVPVFEPQPFSLSVVVQTDSELSPLYQWRKGGTNIANANGASYNVSNAVLADSGSYDCVVTIPNFANTLTSAVATVTFQPAAFVLGYLKYEYFPASNRQLLEAGTTDHPSFAGAIVGSDKSGFATLFESGINFADNYGNRFSGFFIPPPTGPYVFFVSGIFDSDLFVSTDDNPANKRLVAQVPTWTSHRVWNAMPEQRSDRWTNSTTGTAPFAAGISLTAGTPYYIEGVHNGGGGGDNFEATFKLLSDPNPADGGASKFQGNVIAVVVPQPTFLTITNQPQDTSGIAYGGAQFKLVVATDSVIPLAYQWRRNGANANLGNDSSFGFLVSPSDATAQFDCVVMMPGSTNTVTSRTAKATVDNNVQIVAGSLKDESWRNKGGLDLETQNVGVPDTTSYLTNFETLADPWGGGAHRVTGFFTPTVSGNYVFFDASSDSSDLFLSTDDQPANLRLICQEPGWSASRTWTTDTSGPTSLQQKRSDTFVDPVTGTTPYAAGIPLVAGNRYFVYGACSRNFAVTFKVNPADPDPVNGDPPRFTSEMLSHVESGVVTKPTITTFVSGPTLRVSWAPAAGHLESSPVLPPVSWSNLGYANPAYLTINPSSNLFLRVVNP